MPKLVHQLFIASTRELDEHREKVAAVLEALEFLPIRMEIRGALPGTPVEECLRRAREADGLIAIVGHRYGFVPTVAEGGDGRRSITWLEIDAAADAGRPVFAFVAADDAPRFADRQEERLRAVSAAEVEEGPTAVPLLRLRKALGRRVVADFSSSEDLATKVALTLARDLGNLRSPVPTPERPAGVSVRNRHSRIGVQINAHRFDAKALGRHIESILDRLYPDATEKGRGGPEA